MSVYKCPKCKSDLKYLAGASAHASNKYCEDTKDCGWQAWDVETKTVEEGTSLSGIGITSYIVLSPFTISGFLFLSSEKVYISDPYVQVYDHSKVCRRVFNADRENICSCSDDTLLELEDYLEAT